MHYLSSSQDQSCGLPYHLHHLREQTTSCGLSPTSPLSSQELATKPRGERTDFQMMLITQSKLVTQQIETPENSARELLPLVITQLTTSQQKAQNSTTLGKAPIEEETSDPYNQTKTMPSFRHGNSHNINSYEICCQIYSTHAGQGFCLNSSEKLVKFLFQS